MQNSSKIFWGVLLVLFGLVLLIDTTGFFANWSINIWTLIGLFWPLILIFLGIKVLFNNNITGAVILILLGGTFLATNLFHWNFFAILWPVAIIAVGLSVLLRREEASFNSGSVSSDSDTIHDTVAFWGMDKKMTSKNFKGGEIDIAFGGGKLDLRDVTVSKDGASIHVNVAFGGLEIFVPKNCRVVTNGTGVLGGWNPAVKSSDVTEPVLEINGVAAFGGVDIKE